MVRATVPLAFAAILFVPCDLWAQKVGRFRGGATIGKRGGTFGKRGGTAGKRGANYGKRGAKYGKRGASYGQGRANSGTKNNSAVNRQAGQLQAGPTQRQGRNISKTLGRHPSGINSAQFDKTNALSRQLSPHLHGNAQHLRRMTTAEFKEKKRAEFEAYRNRYQGAAAKQKPSSKRRAARAR